MLLDSASPHGAKRRLQAAFNEAFVRPHLDRLPQVAGTFLFRGIGHEANKRNTGHFRLSRPLDRVNVEEEPLQRLFVAADELHRSEKAKLAATVVVWRLERNAGASTIRWRCTTADARLRRYHLYAAIPTWLTTRVPGRAAAETPSAVPGASSQDRFRYRCTPCERYPQVSVALTGQPGSRGNGCSPGWCDGRTVDHEAMPAAALRD